MKNGLSYNQRHAKSKVNVSTLKGIRRQEDSVHQYFLAGKVNKAKQRTRAVTHPCVELHVTLATCRVKEERLSSKCHLHQRHFINRESSKWICTGISRKTVRNLKKQWRTLRNHFFCSWKKKQSFDGLFKKKGEKATVNSDLLRKKAMMFHGSLCTEIWGRLHVLAKSWLRIYF